MTVSLQDNSIVIIGGTTGIGLSAARACIAAGGRVVVVGRNAESGAAALAELGERARLVSGDAVDPATAERAIETAVREWGRLDGLYHVAGGSGRKFGDGPLDQISDDGWRATLDLNLTSVFNSNRAAVWQFLAQGSGGSVLNLGSVLAESPAPKFFATHAYAAAKAAIVGLTRSAAAYYAPHNIRFNVLAPALVETPMSARAAGNSEIMAYVSARQPLDGGRIGQPNDLDAAALYFLSEASRICTGQVLTVDGGWTVLGA